MGFYVFTYFSWRNRQIIPAAVRTKRFAKYANVSMVKTAFPQCSIARQSQPVCNVPPLMNACGSAWKPQRSARPVGRTSPEQISPPANGIRELPASVIDALLLLRCKPSSWRASVVHAVRQSARTHLATPSGTTTRSKEANVWIAAKMPRKTDKGRLRRPELRMCRNSTTAFLEPCGKLTMSRRLEGGCLKPRWKLCLRLTSRAIRPCML